MGRGLPIWVVSRRPNSCQESPPGHYAEEGMPWNLVMCESGTYQPNGGQASCIDSIPGYHVPSEGALSQTICPAGSYQPNAGSQACLLADPGHMVEPRENLPICVYHRQILLDIRGDRLLEGKPRILRRYRLSHGANPLSTGTI